MQRILVLIFFITLTVLDISCNSKSNRDNLDGYLSVKKVIDGDTFWVDDGAEKGVKIRLIGVNAPESRKTGRKEVEYYGKEAKEYLKKLLKDKKVKLEFDIGRFDRFGRTLAYVYLEDGTFVNADIVKNGYAMVMTIPPNVKFAEVFVKLQQEARENYRGLWNER
ncbi:MAG: thermonuclease family protein [Bacteroidia bacterium]|nr:thermonuclease family protein [Bacteroidia bacterium]